MKAGGKGENGGREREKNREGGRVCVCVGSREGDRDEGNVKRREYKE